jgi:hypothetical protein
LCNKTDADEGLMLPKIKSNNKVATTVESRVHTDEYEEETIKITTKAATNSHEHNQFETTEYIPFSTAITNLTELCSQYISPKSLQECSQYPNLIIAFVVCIIFLATNLFMFTLIILHIVMKHLIARKQRSKLQSQSIANESIIEENKNKKKSVKSESRIKTPSTMISESRSNIASPSKRISTTTTPYHQKHNVCCMYDRCYKTDLTSFSKNSLHSRSRSRVIEKPKRSRSLGNKILSCLCGIACPDCENSTSKCHQHMKYSEVNEINSKYKIAPNPNEFARAGYILHVPNPLHNQQDLGKYYFLEII